MASSNAFEFGQSGYRKLVQGFVDRGYRFGGYAGLPNSSRQLIMRHDIDLCVRRARQLAETEQELGVSATYFVLVSTEFYNLHARDTAQDIRAIRDMGHEIGLHFDAAAYEGTQDELEMRARTECEALSGVTDRPVEIISFHRPLPSLQGMNEDFAGRAHTYQSRFFSEIDYCSDSGGSWAYGHPLDRDSIRHGRAMQLVTHPIWWTGGTEWTPVQRIAGLFSERKGVLRSEFQRNLAKGPFTANWISQLD